MNRFFGSPALIRPRAIASAFTGHRAERREESQFCHTD